MPKRLGPHNHTNPLIWCLSIICAILTLLVIIAGIVVFIGYITIRPKVPQVSVPRAQLDTLYFDQASLLMVQITIVVKAENDNTRAHASFYDTFFTLSFGGQKIAILKADPFEVRANQSLELNYVVQSNSIPLNPTEAEEVNMSLKKNVIDLELKGTSRTRWTVWLIGSVKFWLHLDCQLHLPLNRTTAYPSGCSSRSQ
ncbi:late embryogenesis abundant protein [Perilla frutescens var. hirtella]|nr:late embryogenesis abundant protein [Perilla frutescens var. frutescens]KAH6783537.1 late embryogenesis abundant protein [Perilla frutescens var. hirtella]